MRAVVIAIVLMHVSFAWAQAVDEHTLAYWRFDECGGARSRILP